MAGSTRSSWRRWLGVALRSLHLVGVVDAAVGVLGQGHPRASGIILMLVTGFAMVGIDLWHRRELWREVAGAFILVKLALLVAMMLATQLAALLFWVLLIASSIVSHAPRTFRHRRIIG